MVTKEKILVTTPSFRRACTKAGVDFGLGMSTISFDPSRPWEMLLEFRRLASAIRSPSVYVLDIGRFPDETQWVFVSDAVGRSGANPLRGLGRIMKEPFVDVSRLYHVPQGAVGVEVIALGDRYGDNPELNSGIAQMRPLCSHLHTAAILAHTEGLRITGVLVSASAVPEFRLDRVLQG